MLEATVDAIFNFISLRSSLARSTPSPNPNYTTLEDSVPQLSLPIFHHAHQIPNDDMSSTLSQQANNGEDMSTSSSITAMEESIQGLDRSKSNSLQSNDSSMAKSSKSQGDTLTLTGRSSSSDSSSVDGNS